MGNFLAELKRRHMYRVAAAYAVVAWVLLQIVNNVAPGLNLPSWATTLVIVLLAIGFPVALVFAWIGELKSPESKSAGSEAKITRLDYVLAGALIVVIALVSYEQFAPSRSATGQQSGVQAARTVAASPAGAISIAVLPFANLSGDASQEFFSDGMTEEITSALAKITNLRVVARASAFQFKGEKKDMRAVGQALSARYLIDGSVRKAGTRVRISAQLIEAENGLQKWTENYDRELTDIFATQEDIAKAIATSLQVPLGLQQGQSLVSNRNIDPDSYQQYLRGRALVRSRSTGVELKDAADLLEQVVARNPDYAPAWAQLALAYAFTPNFSPVFNTGSAAEFRSIVDASLPRAEMAARRAMQLDPNLADGYLSLARTEDPRGHPLVAEELYQKALALDPNNPEALSLYANLLAGVGRLKEAAPMKQQALALEPYVPVYNLNLAAVLWLNGRDDEAVALLKARPLDRGRQLRLMELYTAAGRREDAIEALREIPKTAITPDVVDAASRILSETRAPNTPPPRLPGFEFLYVLAGAPEQVLNLFERNAEAGFTLLIGTARVWHPYYAPVRKLERFKAYARKSGLVDYWRAKGWPEFCHATTGDDFECS